jgi:DNA-binding LacI/PurR family transcriptional regulator
MELLLERMHGPDRGRRGEEWIKLPCEVVVRQSCGAAIAKG